MVRFFIFFDFFWGGERGGIVVATCICDLVHNVKTVHSLC